MRLRLQGPEKLAGSLEETWRRDNGSQEALVLGPEGLRGWMVIPHRAKGRVAGLQSPDAGLGLELGCTVHPVSIRSPLALLLACLAPSSSQASSLSKSLESRVLQLL